MRSSAHPISRADISARPCRIFTALCLAALLAIPAFADKRDDYQRGLSAANKGDVATAKDAFCAAAAEDSEYKPAGVDTSAQTQCNIYTNELKQGIARWNKNFIDGQIALQKGDLATAESKFRAVKGGDHMAQAQEQLAKVIKMRQNPPAATEAAKPADNPAEDASNRAFQQGVDAWQANNFSAATAAFEQVTGSKRADAQSYISKISSYQTKLGEAQALAGQKDYSAAANAYQQAMAIKADGPGNPAIEAGRMQGLATAAAAQPTAPAQTNAPAANASNSAPATTSAPTHTMAGAIKDTQTRVDEAKSLADARKLMNKREYAQAHKLIDRVLGQNIRNTEAASMLQEVKKLAGTPAAPEATSISDEDNYLAGILGAFYQGNYDDAEAALRNYVLQQPKKPGLANFYLGATLLTQYYLNGSTDSKRYNDAIRRFKEAKAVKGFHAPEKFISPKIMQVYNDATKGTPQPS